MLLRQRAGDGVAVLQVDGAVSECDVERFTAAVDEALRRESRGVVIDLSRVDSVAPVAVDALRRAVGQSGPWPRASLAVCAPPEELRRELDADVQVHADRRQALAHVDDRSTGPRLSVVLEHSTVSPAQARDVVRRWIADLGLEGLREDLLLVVSELVTNAVRYGRPPLTMELEAGAGTVTVAVVDGTPEHPVARVADDDAEGGRGLLLVDLVAAEQGVRPVPPGKAVWAVLART